MESQKNLEKIVNISYTLLYSPVGVVMNYDDTSIMNLQKGIFSSACLSYCLYRDKSPFSIFY